MQLKQLLALLLGILSCTTSRVSPQVPLLVLTHWPNAAGSLMEQALDSLDANGSAIDGAAVLHVFSRVAPPTAVVCTVAATGCASLSCLACSYTAVRRDELFGQGEAPPALPRELSALVRRVIVASHCGQAPCLLCVAARRA